MRNYRQLSYSSRHPVRRSFLLKGPREEKNSRSKKWIQENMKQKRYQKKNHREVKEDSLKENKKEIKKDKEMCNVYNKRVKR